MVVQKYLERRTAPAAIFMSSVPPQGLSVSAMHMVSAAPDLFFQLGLISAFGEQWASPAALVKHLFSGHVPPELAERYIPRLKREAFPPTLVLGGTKDQFVPTWALEMSAHAYGADLEIIKGAAHVLMLDPEWWQATADTMIAWLLKKNL
jgi:pimeloyl-ACP methyl ester carboxylesterase